MDNRRCSATLAPASASTSSSDDRLRVPRSCRLRRSATVNRPIVNDRPGGRGPRSGADGVHVGQEDMPVEQVRRLVGPEMLVGPRRTRPPRSTRRRGSTTSASVRSTRRRRSPGRPAVGLELVRYAAANASVPFFAIGGLRRGQRRRGEKRGRASGSCVLRAIAEAADPQSAARELSGLLGFRRSGAMSPAGHGRERARGSRDARTAAWAYSQRRSASSWPARRCARWRPASARAGLPLRVAIGRLRGARASACWPA